MSHIFISYSRADQALAEQLAGLLKASGFGVWLDLDGIAGGDLWRARIVEAIKQCALFLILVTPDSVASKEVRRELNVADRARKKILPVLNGSVDMPGDFEYLISEVNWIDLAPDPESGFKRIHKAVIDHYLDSDNAIFVRSGQAIVSAGIGPVIGTTVIPLEIDKESAVVIESERGSSVLGAGKHLLFVGQRLYRVVDLRPQTRIQTFAINTADMRQVECTVSMLFQLDDGGQPPTNAIPYPCHSEAVLKSVYGVSAANEKGLVTQWDEVVVSRIANAARHTLSRLEVAGLQRAVNAAADQPVENEIRQMCAEALMTVGAKAHRVVLAGVIEIA